MTQTTSSSILTTGDLQEFVYQTAIRNYQDKRFFMQFGKEHVKPAGFDSVRVFTTKNMSGTVAALTEWVTPDKTAFTLTPIDITLTQYGARVELTDVALSDSPIPPIKEASFELGNDLARQVDIAYQDVLDAGTNVIYSKEEDASAWRTNVDDGDIMSFDYIAEAASRLKTNNAPEFDGGYVAVMHPHVYHDLMVEVWTGGFIDVAKYAEPGKVFRGEIGMLFGVRIVVSSNVQFYANASDGAGSTGNFDVYPTYVFGQDAFHHAISWGMQAFFDPLGKGDDFLRQRANVSVKTRVGFKIVKPEGLYRIESSSTLAANAS